MEWPSKPAAAPGGTAPLADVLLAALSDQTTALSDAAAHFGRHSDTSATHPVHFEAVSAFPTGGLPSGGATTPLRAAAATLDLPRSPGQIDFHVKGASRRPEATPHVAAPRSSFDVGSMPSRKTPRKLSWWAPSRDPECLQGEGQDTQSNPGLLARIGHVGTGLRRVAQIAVDKLGPGRSSVLEQPCGSSKDAALQEGQTESHQSALAHKAASTQQRKAGSDADAHSSDSDQLHGSPSRAAVAPKKSSRAQSAENSEGSTACKQPGAASGIQSPRAVGREQRPQEPTHFQVGDDDLESTRVLGPWAAGWLCSQDRPQQHRRKELLRHLNADQTAHRKEPPLQGETASARELKQMHSNAKSEESAREQQPESNDKASKEDCPQIQQPVPVSHWTIVSSDSEELERRERAVQERERRLQSYEQQLKERERELIAREEDAEDSQSCLQDATIEINKAVEADDKTTTPSCGTQTSQDAEDSQNFFEEVASELSRKAQAADNWQHGLSSRLRTTHKPQVHGYGQARTSPFTQVPFMAPMPAIGPVHSGATGTSLPQWQQRGAMPQPGFSSIRSASEPAFMAMQIASLAGTPRKPGTLRSSYVAVASGIEQGWPPAAPSMQAQNILVQQLPRRTAAAVQSQNNGASHSTFGLQQPLPASAAPALFPAEWLNLLHSEHAAPREVAEQSMRVSSEILGSHDQQRPVRSRRRKHETAVPPSTQMDIDFSFASDAPSSHVHGLRAESSSEACSTASGQFVDRTRQPQHAENAPAAFWPIHTNHIVSHAPAASREYQSGANHNGDHYAGASPSQNDLDPLWSNSQANCSSHGRVNAVTIDRVQNSKYNDGLATSHHREDKSPGKGSSHQQPAHNRTVGAEQLHASAEAFNKNPNVTNDWPMTSTPGGRHSVPNSACLTPEPPWFSSQTNSKSSGGFDASDADHGRQSGINHSLPVARAQDGMSCVGAASFEQYGNDVSFGMNGMKQTDDNPGPAWTAKIESNSCSPRPSREIHWSDPQCNEAFQSGRRACQELWLRPGHLRSDAISRESRRLQKPLVEPHLEPLQLEQEHSRKRTGRGRQSRTGSTFSRRRRSTKRGVNAGQVSQHPRVPSTANDECSNDLPGPKAQQRSRSCKKQNKIKANIASTASKPELHSYKTAGVCADPVAEHGAAEQVPSLQVGQPSCRTQLSNETPSYQAPRPGKTQVGLPSSSTQLSNETSFYQAPRPGKANQKQQTSGQAKQPGEGTRRRMDGSARIQSSGGQRQRRRRERRPSGDAPSAQLPSPEPRRQLTSSTGGLVHSKSADPEDVHGDADLKEVDHIYQDMRARKARTSHHSFDSFEVSSSAGSGPVVKHARRRSVIRHRVASVFQLGDTEDGAEEREESSDWEKVGDSPDHHSQSMGRQAREAAAPRIQESVHQPEVEASPVGKSGSRLRRRSMHSAEQVLTLDQRCVGVLHVDSHQPTLFRDSSPSSHSQRRGRQGREEGWQDDVLYPSHANTPAYPSGAGNNSLTSRAVREHRDMHHPRHAGTSPRSPLQTRKALRERALKSLHVEEEGQGKIAKDSPPKDVDNDFDGLSLAIPESPQNGLRTRTADRSNTGRSHEISPISDVGAWSPEKAVVDRKFQASSGELVLMSASLSAGSDAGWPSPPHKKEVFRVPTVAALKQLATTRTQERARQVDSHVRHNSGSSVEGICFRDMLPTGEPSGRAYWSSQEHTDSFSPVSPASPANPSTPTINVLSAPKASPNKGGARSSAAAANNTRLSAREDEANKTRTSGAGDEAVFASRKQHERFAIKNEADLNFASRQIPRPSQLEEAVPKTTSSDIASPKALSPDGVSLKKLSDVPNDVMKNETQSALVEQSLAIHAQSDQKPSNTKKEDGPKNVEEPAIATKVQASPASSPTSDAQKKTEPEKAEDPELQTILKEAKRIFKELDSDNNQTISKIELLKGLKASAEVRSFFGLPAKIRQEDAESRRALEEVFQGIDRDESKSVSWKELESWISDNKHRRSQKSDSQAPPPGAPAPPLPAPPHPPSKTSSRKQDTQSPNESDEGSSSDSDGPSSEDNAIVPAGKANK